MTPKRLRTTLRTLHLLTMPLVGYYVYSPVHEHPVLQLIGRWVVFPVMLVTGVWMWQWARYTKAMRRRQAGAQRAVT